MGAQQVAPPQGWKTALRTRAPSLWNRVRKSWRVLLWMRRQIIKTRWGVELIRNAAIDRKYGGYCGGRIATRFAETGAHGTSSADYYQLRKLFGPGGVNIRPEDVLADIGCGKGRVINYWLHSGHRNRMYGLELDPDFAAGAARRLRNFPNVSILAGDAIRNLPNDATVLFLFNPFEANVLEALKQRIEEQFRGRLHSLRILYSYPKMAHVFRRDPDWEVKDLQLGTYYPAVLITRRPETSRQAGNGARV